MKSYGLCALLLLPTGHYSAQGEPVASSMPLPAASTGKINFTADIKPILETSCLNCHARGREKGGFRMDTRETFLEGGDSGPVVKLGQSAESHLIKLVAGLDPDSVMPAKGKRLTAPQIGLLRAWIDQGLPWDPHITFARRNPANLKPHKPSVIPDTADARNPIDQLLGPYYREHKIDASQVVSDRLFARRAGLEIVGLLPSTNWLESFVGEAKTDKRAALVRQLLQQNEAYAQHWLSFWNDLLRNDYRGTGYIDGGRKQITGWLYEALRTNLPYDCFVAQLINPSPETEGFVKGIVWRGVVNASQTPEMQAAQNISQVFMGVNLKCASCHDSFINDWRLSDAYGLAAVYHDGPLEMFQCDKPTGKSVEAAFIYADLGKLDANLSKPERLERLAKILTGPEDGRLSRTIVNRLWGRFFGRALVEPVDDMEQTAWHPDLLDWLAEDLVAHKYDLKHTIEVILTSQAYQMGAVAAAESGGEIYVFKGPAVRRLTAEQFRDALGQVTGVWYRKSEIPGVTNNVRASLVAADPMGIALGRPNREQVVTTRASIATTLQALELSNGHTLADMLKDGAEQLGAKKVPADELVTLVYRRALGRDPTTAEKQVAADLVRNSDEKAGIEDLLWSVAMLPEFQLIR